MNFDTVPVLGHRCAKNHRTAEGWARCAFPGHRPIQGKKGRLLVVHPCRLLSAVVVDSLPEAEKVLAWGCTGPCDRASHTLFVVTRKAPPEGVTAGPIVTPGWDLEGGAW